MKTYKCKVCGEEWDFFPGDYNYKKQHYPTVCSHCQMPVKQMIKDIWEVEGLWAVIKQLLKRGRGYYASKFVRGEANDEAKGV